MKFDVLLPGQNHLPGLFDWAHDIGADDLHTVLRTVDDHDFSSVLVCEHLGIPLAQSQRLGSFWMEPISLMGFIVAATSRVRVDSSILVLPYHHPLRLAKSIATLDVLSGGRINVSVGVGHAEAEFAALGVPFTRRGKTTDETLAALDALWTDPDAGFTGDFFDITGVAVAPSPVQKPRPPIYVGGNSAPALRRAARHDGWQPNPIGFELDEVRPLLDYIHAQPEFAGKEHTFDVNWQKPPSGVNLQRGFDQASPAELRTYAEQLVDAYLGRYADAGITRTMIRQPTGVDSLPVYLDFLQWFSAEVITAVDDRTSDARLSAGRISDDRISTARISSARQ